VAYHVAEPPLGLVEGRLNGAKDVEEECDARDREGVVARKHLAQDQGHDHELDDAAARGDDEVAPDLEAHYRREDGVEDDEEEAEADVAPCEHGAGADAVVGSAALVAEEGVFHCLLGSER
jgi:hypothetical protein